MSKKLVIVGFAVLIWFPALVADSGKSPCGHADMPKDVRQTGAVCVSVCGPGFAYNGCASSEAQVATTPSEQTPAAAPTIDFLSIRIYGNNTSVGELAAAIERTTGWTTGVQPDLRSEKLRPAKKRLSGTKGRSLRFRLQQGGKLLVSIDDEQTQLRILSL